MCKDLKFKIYAIVLERPSTPREIARMLGVLTSAINVELAGMDSAGLILYEDDDDVLHVDYSTTVIPDDIIDSCREIANSFIGQMRLPRYSSESDV